LEGGVFREQIDDVVLQPAVGLKQRAGVRVVVNIGNDERELWKGVICKVDGKLAEGRKDGFGDGWITGDIREHGKGVVADDVKVGIAAGIAPVDSLGVDSEADFVGEHSSGNVIDNPDSCGVVVAGEQLARGEHEVIADGIVGVGVVIGGQRADVDEVVQIRPGAFIAGDSGIALVFFKHHYDVLA